MYTPHFFSKIQMLLGPNLAHLLSAQDQGERSRTKLLAFTTLGANRGSNFLAVATASLQSAFSLENNFLMSSAFLSV